MKENHTSLSLQECSSSYIAILLWDLFLREVQSNSNLVFCGCYHLSHCKKKTETVKSL